MNTNAQQHYDMVVAKQTIEALHNYIKELEQTVAELHLTVKQLEDMRLLNVSVKEWPANLYCQVSISVDEVRG